MGNLSTLVGEIVLNTTSPKTRPDMKNVTLRLPTETHKRLEVIQRLAGTSKTVAAEDILVNAVEDVYQQLVVCPDLEDFWYEEHMRADEQAERDRQEAEDEAFRRMEEAR